MVEGCSRSVRAAEFPAAGSGTQTVHEHRRPPTPAAPGPPGHPDLFIVDARLLVNTDRKRSLLSYRVLLISDSRSDGFLTDVFHRAMERAAAQHRIEAGRLRDGERKAKGRGAQGDRGCAGRLGRAETLG
ncbi:hypothetical protein Sm713_54660 [Streptomyces sp. TS71-3]|nr:hypothetical protein Sm713_54660 [Streptomyces sp. TS71-3]